MNPSTSKTPAREAIMTEHREIATSSPMEKGILGAVAVIGVSLSLFQLIHGRYRGHDRYAAPGCFFEQHSGAGLFDSAPVQRIRKKGLYGLPVGGPGPCAP